MQDVFKNFLTPQNIQVQAISPSHFRIVLEPFERGFGYTLGNALTTGIIVFNGWRCDYRSAD